MATMNPTANGGPVGGMMMMMNNGGSPAMAPNMNTPEQSRRALNGHIFEYLLKHGHYDAARSLSQDTTFDFLKSNKSSPGRGKNGTDLNGEGDAMDMDNSKDEAPDDIPRPDRWDGTQGNGFLLEWFNVFSDIFGAHRGQRTNATAFNYLTLEKQNQRQREMANPVSLQRGMTPAMLSRMNGANGNLKQQQQMTNQQLQMLSQKRAQMAAQQMNRADQPEQDMNGLRPATPADGESGGSPSKRQRMNDGQQNFANGMMQNGRPGGPPNGQGQMLMQSFQPGQPMNAQMRQNGAMPPKNMQGPMAGNMMMNAGSPMMQGMGQFPEGMTMNFNEMQRNMGQAGQPNMQAGGGTQSGNHALQDYQMQLMLLEQQNKKRLMMARQEQHENNPAGGQMPGVTMPPSGMSPNGSRTGASPNPDSMAGRSPTAMNSWMMQGDLGQQMYVGKDGQLQMPPGPQNMRPPTSNAADMGPMRQAGPRPAQFPGSQPMVQQGSQAGNQIGTPGNRDMPPPQAPAGGSAQRNQGASPNNGNAPPTPSQSNKPPPKNNKKTNAKDDNTKKRANTKKNATANNGNNDENPPATPTPSTPITPNNPGLNNKGQPGMQGQQQHPAGQNMPMAQGMQGNDMGFNFPDGGNGEGNQQYNVNLDFSTLESTDVLENFDFDSFLNTSAEDSLGVGFADDFGNDFSMGQTE